MCSDAVRCLCVQIKLMILRNTDLKLPQHT